MKDLSGFHDFAMALMAHIGFQGHVMLEDQEVMTLTLEQRFLIHFGCVDGERWFLLAELGECVSAQECALLLQALRHNQMTTLAWQPIASLNEKNCLCLHLILPGNKCDLSIVISAFDALLDSVKPLLHSGLSVNSRI
ncbi:CesT family type III secretion system chaperone [Chromobacterium vaccinii]|uniref:CesT family type III secretion system chaperone n=1 Tax=Chromobacterium vaccinii TaxID=1108595 RepID=UPI000698B30D|nr:CesT family type III secretion system chaperone [Chromobacterium vaccinii]